ncbi:UDP-glucose 4-epimerase [Candidatus Falkowbacteria bacterium CG10_big_fil_rev_8_21_14_0_10_39_9]|uniref:UDP-glucose 4-epimerase n=1 Tax=Candidatus Falkowbacteria bacterium CG10_big_fil_rev_8_21_14_0_10_39_9 TaxID=1974566 RepID=A0A2M6WPB2_9BACT|nr:MAG: UDP-glucose 4-epimerase [Candidatus Falkowbacteria bacterium CG10_big_fil_rev_8_21_14_0_10_39_9]
MKILVTGGAGFIASTLVDKLIEAGHQVVIIDDLSSGLKEYINPQAHFYRIDILAPKVEEIFALQKFDFVFHLAAQISVVKSVENPELDNRINVLGGLNILACCLKHQVKKIIFVSTGGALYGEAEVIPTPEDYPTYPLSPYGIHKLTFEKYLHYYYTVYGQSYTTLRLANVYGPRQYKGGECGVVSIFIDNAVNDRESIINGDGAKTRDFVYVDDVVSALLRALETDYVGAINIGTGVEKSVSAVVLAIELALGKSIKKKTGPAKAGEQEHSCLAISKAKDILGWEPQVMLDEGIKKTIAWSKEKLEK